MNKSILLAALAFAALAHADAGQPPSTEEALVAEIGTATFKPVEPKGEMPKGVQAALVAKDPATGGTVAYAKLPAGLRLPSHWHSHAEYTAMISGKGEFTIDGKKHAVAAGSYIVVPAKAHHSLTCGDQECVLLTRRAGPTDYNWVK